MVEYRKQFNMIDKIDACLGFIQYPWAKKSGPMAWLTWLVRLACQNSYAAWGEGPFSHSIEPGTKKPTVREFLERWFIPMLKLYEDGVLKHEKELAEKENSPKCSKRGREPSKDAEERVLAKKKRKDEVVAERQHKQEERAVRQAPKDKARKAEAEREEKARKAADEASRKIIEKRFGIKQNKKEESGKKSAKDAAPSSEKKAPEAPAEEAPEEGGNQ